MTDLHAQRILILDFGGQTTQLIARRIREAGVYCEIHAWDIDDSVVQDFKPAGVVLSGGPESVLEPGSPTIPATVLSSGVPVLGICYGMQAMVHQLDGQVVAQRAHSEFGYASVTKVGSSVFFEGLHDRLADEMAELDVWMSHGDRVEALPSRFSVAGTSDNAPIAMIANDCLLYTSPSPRDS